jgi:hypothetical protein
VADTKPYAENWPAFRRQKPRFLPAAANKALAALAESAAGDFQPMKKRPGV